MKKMVMLIVFFLIVVVEVVIAAPQKFPTSPIDSYVENLTLAFGETNRNFPGKLHAGDDITGDAGISMVYATLDGSVTFSENWKTCPNWGRMVVMEHVLPNCEMFSVVYGHLDRNNTIPPAGSFLKQGDHVGYVGHFACWGDHLHFGVYKGQFHYEPLSGYPLELTGYMRPVLFPGQYVDPYVFLNTPLPPASLETIGKFSNCEYQEPLTGIFTNAWSAFGGEEQIGLPFDDGGSVFVHDWWQRPPATCTQSDSLCLQNFDGGKYGPNAIFFNPLGDVNGPQAYAVSHGFWEFYRFQDGVAKLGYPFSDEMIIACEDNQAVTYQVFQRGMLLWKNGSTLVDYIPGCTEPCLFYGFPSSSASMILVSAVGDFCPETLDCKDSDGDGYGVGDTCPEKDCNDFDASVYPGAEDICEDGIDQDCDGEDGFCVSECIDNNGDGYGIGVDCLGPDCDEGNAGLHVCIYSCQWHTQDPNVAVTLAPGAERDVVVSYTNTGNLAWHNDAAQFPEDTIYLVSCDVNGNQVPSFLAHPAWDSSEIVGTFIKEDTNGQSVTKVSPGENAWWTFRVKVPQNAPEGQRKIYFRPYHTKGGFIEEWGGMHFVINIKKGVSGGEMVFVPAGKFVRGACNEIETDNGVPCVPGSLGYDVDADLQETPVREIFLDAYWIDKTEVTVSSYRECVNVGICPVPDTTQTNCNWRYTDREDHPIDCISWYDAKNYCEWRVKRLPTEAEWEKASRGGCEIGGDPNICDPGIDDRKYPWGNEQPNCHLVNFSYNNPTPGLCTDSTTRCVGSYPTGVSSYGALDMSGNVSEFVQDWFNGGYTETSLENPHGPTFGTIRVVRSSWSFGEGLRSAFRAAIAPEIRGQSLGFRCAKSE